MVRVGALRGNEDAARAALSADRLHASPRINAVTAPQSLSRRRFLRAALSLAPAAIIVPPAVRYFLAPRGGWPELVNPYPQPATFYAGRIWWVDGSTKDPDRPRHEELPLAEMAGYPIERHASLIEIAPDPRIAHARR